MQRSNIGDGDGDGVPANQPHAGGGADNFANPQTDQVDVDYEPEKDSIHFLDAVGRKYWFPYEGVCEWEQMEAIIKSSFGHIDVIRDHVNTGQYDLFDAQNRIILPQFWKHNVRPGSRVTMKMWPSTRPQPQPQPRPRPGFPNMRPRPQPPPAPPPPVPLSWSQKVDNIDATVPPNKRREPGLTFAEWMAGKKKRTTDGPPGLSGSLVRRTPTASNQRGGLGTVPPPGWPQGQRQPAGPPPPPPPPLHRSSVPMKSRSRSVSDVSSVTSSYASRTTTDFDQDRIRRYVVDEDAVFSLKMSKGELEKMESRVQRRSTFHGLERNLKPFERLQLSSARIIGCDGSEPLELVKANLTTMGQPAGSDGMTWIHVQRPHMDFAEFEDIARFELSKDLALQNAIGLLLRAVRDKKWDKDWHVKPGTVLRCDIHIEDEDQDLANLSPVFASMPNLHIAKLNRKLIQKETETYCPPRRLHEAFGQLDRTTAHDKMQQFRKVEGAKTDEILWGGQTWILVTKAGLVTYGDLPRAQLESDNITISDSAAPTDSTHKIVQLIDSQKRLSFAPLDQCRSFFELQGVVRHHAQGMDYDVRNRSKLRLETMYGEELTAGKWSSLLRGNEIPMIRWHLDDSASDTQSISEKGSSTPGSSISDPDKGEGSRGRPRSRSATSSLRSKSASSLSSNASARMARDEDEDDVNFLSRHRPKVEAAEEAISMIPEPDPRVPPFLSWTPGNDKLSKSGDTLMERLTLAEAGIMRSPEKPHRDDLLEEAYKAFHETDVFFETQPKSFKDFEYRRKSLKSGSRELHAFPEGCRFSAGGDERMLVLVDEMFDLSTRVFEAFAPKELQAPSISRCFGALSRVLQDPTKTKALQYGDEAEISDPDPEDSPADNRTQTWVISLQAQNELPRPGQSRCDDCDKGKVYSSASRATTHLRRSHAVGLKTDNDLKVYVLTIREAAEERLHHCYREVVRQCRETMGGIARKTASIQAGVIYRDEFKGPAAGLPPPLFKAFKLLVVFLCAIPRLLDTISWLYKDDVLRSRPRYLSSINLETQKRVVYNLGEAVEGQVRNAERVLASPELSSDKDDGLIKGQFMNMVGPSYLAAHIIGNLLRVPIYESKHVADLYAGYLRIQRSQVLRRPEKRLVLSIGALKDEMSLISEFKLSEADALKLFVAVLAPDSHVKYRADAEAFEQLELEVFDRIKSHVLKQSDHLDRMDKACDHLIDEVRGLAEIMADQNSRAMMIFTVVTVLFLPPGFVAAYLSMGDGPDNLDFAAIQRRFWTIAGPLTTAVWIVCIFLAFEGSMDSPLNRARAALGEWQVRRMEKKASKEESSGDDGPYVVEYTV